MTALGILIYKVKDLSILKTLLDHLTQDITVIYDPSIVELTQAQLLENVERFNKLQIFNILAEKDFNLDQVYGWERACEEVANKSYKQPLYIGQAIEHQGPALLTPMLTHAVEDGVGGRGYSGMLLADYLEGAPNFSTLIFADPAYSVLKPWAEELASRGDFQLVDPLEEAIRPITIEAQGQVERELEFYWTNRDFRFERIAAELLQRPIKFKMWHNFSWLRY